jgi:hypothetical protein
VELFSRLTLEVKAGYGRRPKLSLKLGMDMGKGGFWSPTLGSSLEGVQHSV